MLQAFRYEKNEFWHIVLDEESSFFTILETPFGKFRRKRLPFSVSVYPEEFQRRVDDALKDLPGVYAVHDDIIVWGKGEDGRNLRQLLQRCQGKKGITLNYDKVEYKKTEISYLGLVSKEGMKADPMMECERGDYVVLINYLSHLFEVD